MSVNCALLLFFGRYLQVGFSENLIEFGAEIVDFRFFDSVGREQSYHVVLRDIDEYARLHKLRGYVVAVQSVAEFHALQKPQTFHVIDELVFTEVRKFAGEVFALFRDLVDKSVFEFVDHDGRRRARELITRKRRAVIADGKSVRHVAARKHRGNRQAAAQAFRDGDDIGFKTVVFEREHLARSAHTGLNFVQHKQYASASAQRVSVDEVVVVGGAYRASALNYFQHNRADIAFERVFERVEITVRNVTEAGSERRVDFIMAFLPGGGEGSESSAVERAVRGNDDGTVKPALVVILADEFECALVGFRAAVRKEHFRKYRAVEKFLAQHRLFFVVVEVGRMNEFARLLGNRFYEVGVVVAEAVDSDAGNEIGVLLAGRVVKFVFVAVDETNVLSTENAHIVFVRQFFDFF